MHYALKASKIQAKVIAAVDINPHANLVYRHNFKDTKILQKTIEGIKIEEYDKLDFDMILMSPPCQPVMKIIRKLFFFHFIIRSSNVKFL